MKFLAVPSCLDGVHHDVFSRHKGKFGAQPLFYDLRIYLQPIRDIQAQIQNAVHSQEALGNRDALVGGIVQSALKPLGARGDSGIDHIRHDIAGQGADSLAPHGIALIGHSRGTDLGLFEGFLHFLQMLEKADIGGHFHGS